MTRLQRVSLQYFEGCPNWRVAAAELVQALEELGLEVDIAYERIEDLEEAEMVGFHGSPTILIDGVDPFADPAARVGLACRVYPTAAGASGSPGVDAIRRALAERLT